jgi:hypothetical protein
MTLAIGIRIGPNEIVEPIGAGGPPPFGAIRLHAQNVDEVPPKSCEQTR